MDPVAKTLILTGLSLIVVGIAWRLGWIQALRLGRLPGDIFINRDNMKVYFPLTTGLLISLFLSFIMWFLRR